MRGKTAFLVGGLIGYVMGTRAGREQFEKIAGQARRVWEDPRVQEKVNDASQRATSFVQDVAPDLKDKVTDAVRKTG
ncbi:MAG: YtxH domain-containing protein [Actinomycetales bacterium]|nr:YtxH domain-containing protein [Actinomycetales bacterium]